VFDTRFAFYKKIVIISKAHEKKAREIKQSSSIASTYKIGKVEFEKKIPFFHSVKLFPLYVE